MKIPPPETVEPWKKFSLKITSLSAMSGTGLVWSALLLKPMWPMPPPLPSEKLPHTQFSVTA